MIVIVAGDRHYANADPKLYGPATRDLLDDYDREHFDEYMAQFDLIEGPITQVVSGRANGGDTLGEIWANTHRRDLKTFPANWRPNGGPLDRSAGPKRNIRMLNYLLDARVRGIDVAVIAFHRNLATSKGTKHMVSIAREAGVPVFVANEQPQRTLGL